MTLVANKDGTLTTTKVTYIPETNEIVYAKYKLNYEGTKLIDVEDVVSNSAVYAVFQWMVAAAKQNSTDKFSLSWPFEDYEMVVRRKEKK